MNYWPAETGNLSECHLPLTDLLKELSVTGRQTAEGYYCGQGGYRSFSGGGAAAVCDLEDEFKEKSSSGRYR